ncbi:TPA: hypothetical protein DDW35_00690 [Candidatus Sumerlaeota bacterium]|jgi:hypothetical protein|nr:hypothetical protein [Candidatus Sumerlaeota bacterium]
MLYIQQGRAGNKAPGARYPMKRELSHICNGLSIKMIWLQGNPMVTFVADEQGETTNIPIARTWVR